MSRLVSTRSQKENGSVQVLRIDVLAIFSVKIPPFFVQYIFTVHRGLRGPSEGVPRAFRGLNLSEPPANPLPTLRKEY